MFLGCLLRLGHDYEVAVHTWAGESYFPWCLRPKCAEFWPEEKRAEWKKGWYKNGHR